MISPSTQALETAIRAFVALGSGLNADTHVLRGPVRGSGPNELYASVTPIGAEPQGVPYDVHETAADTTVRVSTVNTVHARYSVQWYREGARDAARRFAVWAWSLTGSEAASSKALTFLRTSEVRQIDAIISDAWEERAGLDLDIGYLEKTEETADVIETVPVELGFDGESVNIEVTHGA